MFLMPSRFVWVLLVCCCFLASAVSAAVAAPADTDRSFGQEGVVTFDSAAGAYTTPSDLAVGPDDSIYVLRTTFHCPGTACVVKYPVSRLRPNGGPDTSFGAGGTSSALGTLADGAVGRDASLALGADGRVVVASADSGQLVLWRLDANGGLDAGFGAGGVARHDFGAPIRRVRVAVGADGRPVIAAEPERGYGGGAVIVARFTVGGGLDPTFHGGAPLFTSLGSGFGGAALTSAGGLLLAGPICCGTAGRAVHVARLDATGAFDSGFGRAGELFVDDVANNVGVGAVVALPKGRIYVVGSSLESGDAFAMRLRSNGKLDRSFGHRGIAYMRRSFLRVAGASVNQAGRLLVFGSSPTGTSLSPGNGPKRLTVLRRLADGRRDPAFGGGSLVRLFTPSGAHAAGGDLQEGRMLVVLGSYGSCIRSCESPTNFLVRFIGGSSAPRCLGHRATIVGTRRGERLVGTRHRDVIVALAGNDIVRGRGGDDVICGGRGDDRLIGGKGRDLLRGGAGHNQLHQ